MSDPHLITVAARDPHLLDQNGDEKPKNVEPFAPHQSPADAVRDIKSPGVVRVEALAQVLTTWDRIFIFFGVFLLAYAYGLDGTLRGTYQVYATSSFNHHSLTSTINVLRAVIGAAAQPTAAKIADVFGRVELIMVSVVFYILGTVIETVSKDVATFAAGTAIYQIGYTMVILLVEIIIADITSTRSRLFFTYLPALPFIINTWISGNITAAVLANTSWQWGYGMWCIIYPACTLPLIISLLIVSRRARRLGLMDNYKSSFQILGARDFFKKLFHLLDVIGIILLIALFALILIPLTLAGGENGRWDRAYIIAPLVIGVVCIPVFVFWELKAPHPLVPFKLMKDRSVWAPICIAICYNFAWTIQADFLYTVLVVAFDFSITYATRISSLYSFCSVLAGSLLGLIVFKVRRLKVFIVVGTTLYMVAFGLLIRFRGSTPTETGKSGVIAAQVLLGIAGGMFPYPVQASLQVQLKHENLAVMTAIYLSMYNIGSALGNAVSGAVWTQVLPGALRSRLRDPALAAAFYGKPLEIVTQYPFGTVERTAVVDAYRSTQRLLVIIGLCLCVPLIAFAFALRNPKLNEKQTLANEGELETIERIEAREEVRAA